VASFGDQLRRERERKGMQLEDVSLATKVSTRFLRALEEERLDQLPGGIFNKGFIKAYARHLGLDENEIVAEYLATVERKTSAAVGESNPLTPGAPARASEVRQPPPRQPVLRLKIPEFHVPAPDAPRHHADRIPWGKMAMALLLVAFAFALWGSFSRQPWPARKRYGDKLPAVQAAAKAPESAAQVAAGNSATVAGTEQPAAAPTEASAPAASTTAEPRPIAASTAPAAQAAGVEAAGAVSKGPFIVLILAKQDSWLQITVDGKEVMQDFLSAPGQKAVSAQREVVVKAGNVGGLEFSFNGRKLPAQGGEDEVKTLTFGSDGLQAPVSRKPLETQAGRPQA